MEKYRFKEDLYAMKLVKLGREDYLDIPEVAIPVKDLDDWLLALKNRKKELLLEHNIIND